MLPGGCGGGVKLAAKLGSKDWPTMLLDIDMSGVPRIDVGGTYLPANLSGASPGGGGT